MSGAPRPTRPADPTRSPRAHLRRAFGRDRNPLGRPLDRSRSRALLLAAAGAVLAVATAAWTGSSSFDSAHRHAVVTAAHLHRVEAVLLGPARPAADTVAGTPYYRADAAWTDASGRPGTGTVDVSRAAAAGSTTGIWLGDTGRPATAPDGTTDLVVDAVCTGLLTLGGLCVLVASGLGARLGSLDRRADRQWQESWRRLEPVWSGRAPRENRPG